MQRMNKVKDAKRRARKAAQKPGAVQVIPDRREKLKDRAERRENRYQSTIDRFSIS